MDAFFEQWDESCQRKCRRKFGARLVRMSLPILVTEIQNRDVCCGGLGYNVFDEAIEEFGTVLDRKLRVGSKLSICQHSIIQIQSSADLAQRIKNLIEEDQNLALCDLGYVVHSLAGIVSDSCILIIETC